jgi:hypothetical protein
MTRDTAAHALAHGWLIGEERPRAISRATLNGIRTMHATLLRGIETLDPDNEDMAAALAELAGAIAGYVPDLLDEIDRLQADEPERMRVYKMDRTGGMA